MTATRRRTMRTERINLALDQLRSVISARYPDAEFRVVYGDEESRRHVWLYMTVDIEDTAEVYDVIEPLQHDVWVERQLPVYVSARWPAYRLLEELDARDRAAGRLA